MFDQASSPFDEVWLVRFSKKAVWGAEARAKPFMTRAMAEACIDRLTKQSVQICTSSSRPRGQLMHSRPPRTVSMVQDHKRDDLKRRHGKTIIATLRRICGDEFAPEVSSGLTVSEAFEQIDPDSLGKLVQHHERGELPRLIAFASVFVQ